MQPRCEFIQTSSCRAANTHADAAHARLVGRAGRAQRRNGGSSRDVGGGRVKGWERTRESHRRLAAASGPARKCRNIDSSGVAEAAATVQQIMRRPPRRPAATRAATRPRGALDVLTRCLSDPSALTGRLQRGTRRRPGCRAAACLPWGRSSRCSRYSRSRCTWTCSRRARPAMVQRMAL
eukprot:168655-Chlamydomonas_euryale.AAC.5